MLSGDQMVDDYLNDEMFKRMLHPVCFSDLNPIENVWYMLGRKVAPSYCPYKEFDSLKEFFWRNGMKYLIDSAFLITLYTLSLTCVQHWFTSGETEPPYKINYLSKKMYF